MAVKSKEDILSDIKEFLNNDSSDSTLNFMEDISDTILDLEKKVADTTDWKAKYEANDREWREKYKERFFSNPIPPEIMTQTEPEPEPKKPLDYADLFKTE